MRQIREIEILRNGVLHCIVAEARAEETIELLTRCWHAHVWETGRTIIKEIEEEAE